MTRLDRARRLLAALDDLAGQEAVLLRSLDLVEAIQISEKAAPLVDEICQLAGSPEVQEIRPQIQALVDLRSRNAELLATHLARVQGELQRVDEARRRVARTAPAYRQAAVAETYRGSLNTAA